MAAMLIETEATPNPATRKFLPGRTVMDSGTRDFTRAEDAEASPLAAALFATGKVEGVFFGRDFVSVTARPDGEWESLEPAVLELLEDAALRQRMTDNAHRLLEDGRGALQRTLALIRPYLPGA